MGPTKQKKPTDELTQDSVKPMVKLMTELSIRERVNIRDVCTEKQAIFRVNCK